MGTMNESNENPPVEDQEEFEGLIPEILEIWDQINIQNFDSAKYYSNEPAETLYHYTTIDSLSSIIKNNEFWITNVQYQNDRSEITYGLELSLEVLNNAIKLKEESIEKILDDMTLTPVHPKAASLGTALLKGINQRLNDLGEELYNVDVYVGSFSEEEDLLGQWRGYTQNGVGVSIGFNIEKIKDSLPNTPNKPRLWQCVYDLNNQKEMYKELFRNYLRWINDHLVKVDSHLKRMNSDEYNEFIIGLSENIKNSLLLQLLNLYSITKNNTFERESEWRVIVPINNPRDYPTTTLSSKTELTPTYKLNFETDVNDENNDDQTAISYINKIILGPSSNDLTEDSIQYEIELSKHSNDIELIHSNVPLK